MRNLAIERTNRNRGLRIEIAADSMRVGKTTAVKVIAEGLRKRGMRVSESYEDWQHNPYLKKSYADPAKNFLESQKWFIRRKFEQVRDGGEGIFIQDVAPETDYNYAETNRRLGRMSEEHFVEYDKFYRSLDWSLAPSPDLLVYLQIGDDELIRRALDSKREFESVEPEYFLMMKRVNREWLKEISNHKFPARSAYCTAVAGGSNSQMKILIVDTDKLDFAHDEGAKRELVERVVRSCKMMGEGL
ncbi:MAG: deoxynucleoside kinase [bacterium]